MENSDCSKSVCIAVCFLFAFVILVLVVRGCNKETFVNVGDIIRQSNSNIKTMFTGGKLYNNVKNNEDIFLKLKNNKGKDAVLVVIAAEWCGYCKKLKNSGVLRDISKKYKVFELTDKHPQSKILMQNLQAGGFPTLAIYVNGKMMPYKGPRDYDNISKAMEVITNVSNGVVSKDNDNKDTVDNDKKTVGGDVVNVPADASKADLDQQVSARKKMGNEKFCLMILADWCGHCKRLKSSGVIDDLVGNGVIVFTADDKSNIAKELDVKGFPSIMIWKNDQLTDYNGSRTTNDIVEFMSK
jgi:thiol-disulfide isomerase/thioredoxin